MRKTEITKAIKKFIAQRKANEKKFRKDHQALATEIATIIRMDDEPNKPSEMRGHIDGKPHWYQGDWGGVTLDNENRLTMIKGKEYGTVRNTILVECPTTACVAGWAATLAGYPLCFKTYDTSIEEFVKYHNEDREEPEVYTASECYDPDTGYQGSVMRRGRELLNLTEWTADWLFSSDRNKAEVLKALDIIAETGALTETDIDNIVVAAKELEDAEV